MTASSLGPIASITPVAPSASPQSSTHGNPPPPDADRSFARALDRAAGERKQGDKKARTERNARHDDPSRPPNTQPTPTRQGQAEPAVEEPTGDATDGRLPAVDPALGLGAELAAPTRGPGGAPIPATTPVPGQAVRQGLLAADVALLNSGANATVGMATEAPLHAAENLTPGQATGGSVPPPAAGGATAAAASQPAVPTSPPTQSTPVEVPFHARPDQPGFHGALGAQLSILARNGVTEARLHLNPAELGPVWVQISVNGQAARIDMAAEHILTRQALEQSMPALASALRDSGLTLTGGGVFEQPNQPGEPGQPGGQHGGRRGSGPGGPAQPEPAALPAPRARGMVDLYA